MHKEELESSLDALGREANMIQVERDRLMQERDREKENAENLSTVLHDFQTSKDREIENLTTDLRQELQSATRMMSEYKQRSIAAEVSIFCMSVGLIQFSICYFRASCLKSKQIQISRLPYKKKSKKRTCS